MSLMNNRFFVEEVSDLLVNGNSFNFVDNYVSLGIVDDFNAMLSFNFFFCIKCKTENISKIGKIEG